MNTIKNVIDKRNTEIAQKVFALTLKSICDVEAYTHNFTREQKLAVLKEMDQVLSISLKFVRDQIKALGGDLFI